MRTLPHVSIELRLTGSDPIEILRSFASFKEETNDLEVPEVLTKYILISSLYGSEQISFATYLHKYSVDNNEVGIKTFFIHSN